MLIVDGAELKGEPAKSKKTPTLLPQLVKSIALHRASQRFEQAEASTASDQLQKNICVLQGEYAEVDLTKVRQQSSCFRRIQNDEPSQPRMIKLKIACENCRRTLFWRAQTPQPAALSCWSRHSNGCAMQLHRTRNANY